MKTRNLLYSDFTLTFSNKGSLFPQTIRCPILSCPWFLCWLCFWSTLFSLFLFCLSLIFPPLHLSLWEYKQVQHLQNLVIDRLHQYFFSFRFQFFARVNCYYHRPCLVYVLSQLHQKAISQIIVGWSMLRSRYSLSSQNTL